MLEIITRSEPTLTLQVPLALLRIIISFESKKKHVYLKIFGFTPDVEKSAQENVKKIEREDSGNAF